MNRMRLAACCAFAMLTAARAAGIRPVDARPAATIGGVLGVQLTADGPAQWPARIALQRDDGGKPVEGVVAWVSAAAPALDRTWTTADERLDIRPVARAPQGQPAEATGALVLLAEMPLDCRGSLRLGEHVIEPAWMPLSQPTPDQRLPAMPAGGGEGLDRPDAGAPSEWFRWWLLADEMRARPPAPPGDRVAQLFAMHRAQLWQAGLDRIERVSPGVAREVRERLTATSAETRGNATVRLAAWIARGDDLSFLLGTMLDPSRSDEQVMQAVLTRLRAEPPVICWVEADSGGTLRVAIANAQPQPMRVRASWVESPFGKPVQIDLPGGGISRHAIERPSELLPDPLSRSNAPLGGTLVLQGDGWSLKLAVGPAQIVPRPPGHSLGLLRPPLSLAEAQRQRIAPPPAEWCTTASLRRRFGTWEVFAECLRPAASELDELEVVVGEATRGLVRIRVREQGEPIVQGPPGIDPPKVTRGSFADRWRCVIEVPGSWLESPTAGARLQAPIASTLLLGVARSPGGAGTRQTGALAVPGWMPMPVLSLDPRGWWGASRPDDSGRSPAAPVPALAAPSKPVSGPPA